MLKKGTFILLLIAGSASITFAQQTTLTDTTKIHLICGNQLYATPLYILDGKIIDQKTVEAIKPETINRIDVLKNESATERYGEMGKNGAVIITSKGQEKQGFKRSKQRRS